MRVLVPYFIVISLIYAFEQRDFLSRDYLLEITGLCTQYWYIAFWVKWYIAYWLFSRFFLCCRTLLLLLMAVAVLLFFPNIEGEQAFSFVAGYGASVGVARLRSLSVRSLCLWALAFFFVATAFWVMKQMPFVRGLEDTFVYNVVQCGIKLPYASFFVALLSVVPGLTGSRFLLFTGALSYELYLVQMPFYSRLAGSLGYVLLFCIMCYVLAYLLHSIDRKVASLMC